jgi:hypothetical protein
MQLQQIQTLQLQEQQSLTWATQLAQQRASVRLAGGQVEELTDTRKKRKAVALMQRLQAKVAQAQQTKHLGEGAPGAFGGAKTVWETAQQEDLRRKLHGAVRGTQQGTERSEDRDGEHTREERDTQVSTEKEDSERDKGRRVEREKERSGGGYRVSDDYMEKEHGRNEERRDRRRRDEESFERRKRRDEDDHRAERGSYERSYRSDRSGGHRSRVEDDRGGRGYGHGRERERDRGRNREHDAGRSSDMRDRRGDKGGRVNDADDSQYSRKSGGHRDRDSREFGHVERNREYDRSKDRRGEGDRDRPRERERDRDRDRDRRRDRDNERHKDRDHKDRERVKDSKHRDRDRDEKMRSRRSRDQKRAASPGATSDGEGPLNGHPAGEKRNGKEKKSKDGSEECAEDHADGAHMRAGGSPGDDAKEVGRASEEGQPSSSHLDSTGRGERGGADRTDEERVPSNGKRVHHEQDGASKRYDSEGRMDDADRKLDAAAQEQQVQGPGHMTGSDRSE